ncbi:MAG: response regulator [Candidatus Omnitrophota bacterium]
MVEIKYDIRKGADIYRSIYISRLQKWISTGKVKMEETFVWRSGLSGWRRLDELDEFKLFLKQCEKRRNKEKPIVYAEPLKKQIKNILIVEDEEDLCALLADFLSSKNYKVEVVNTRRNAISQVKKEAPDLIFLDLKLPDGDGIKLLSKIRKISPQTLVTIISAYGDDEIRREAKRKGVFAFIDKPFTEEDILRNIRKIAS